MNALVVVNSSEQDQGLGVAFDAAMEQRDWKSIENSPSGYSKSFGSSGNPEAIAKQTREEVEAAVIEAEWTNMPYLFLLSEQAPQQEVAKG